MFIKYEENDLTKLFQSNPIYIYGKEAGMFIYSFSDGNGIKITLYTKRFDEVY